MRIALTLQLALLLLAGAAFAQEWNQQTVDNSASVGKYTAIAHDPNGVPHIVYLDETNNRYMYSYYNLEIGAWHQEELFEFNPSQNATIGAFCDIIITSSNRVNIVFVDKVYNTCSLYFLQGLTGATLSRSTIYQRNTASYSDANFINPSIAVSGSSRYVTFYDNYNQQLMYFEWLGSGWEERSIDASLGVGQQSDLAVSPAGKIYCSYCEADGNMIRLGFQDDSNDWFNIPIEQGANLDIYSSVAVDANEDIHVAYRDIDLGLKHATITRATLKAYAEQMKKSKEQHSENLQQ